MPAPLPAADLEWRDGLPWSRAFGDSYWSRHGARAEREHVFVRGQGFGAAGDDDPGRWRERRRWTFGELGFGGAVTFVSAWAAFRRHAAADAQLDWVSVELAPLAPDDLRRVALADTAMGAFVPLVDELVAALPPRVPGIHRRTLDGGRVRLTLLQGDVLELLPEVEFAADAWCLDGFAPDRNPAMWSDEAIAQVAAHTRPGTTAASYAAASAVGMRLEAHGFEVTRRPGAYGKREMISARLERAPAQAPTRPLPAWFAAPGASADASPSRALVIGAGLAGAAAARALAGRGIPVEVIDARAPATGASAAPRAVLAPHCASWQSPQTRVVAAAFLHALAEYRRLGIAVDRTGLAMPVAPDDAWATEAMLADWGWPTDQACLVDGAAASALAGTPLGDLETPRDAIHFPTAGTIEPANAVRAMLDHPSVTVHRHAPIARIARDDGRWNATAEDGRCFSADVLVLATGGLPPGTLADMPQALGASAAPSVPFDATRGQLSLLGFTDHPGLPRVTVSGNGYVMPPRDGIACVGATFEREELERPTSPRDDAINLGHAQRLLPALREAIPARAGAWAGLRCSVNDHCPVVGPSVAESSFRTAFERLAHGPLAARWPAAPALPGLFLSLAHGSRGTSTALLAAELIADMVSGSPRCVGNGLLPALLPQRFLVRSLRTARA